MPTAIREELERRLRPRSQTPGPQLRVLRPGLPELSHPLHGSLYRIGRAIDNSIVIDHTAVSRHHALLENHGGHWLLTDAGSTNGLWWQGRRVRVLVLRQGDQVRFGPADQEDLPSLLFEPEGGLRRAWLGRWGARGALVVAGAGGLLLALSLLQVPTRGSLATVRGPLLLYDRNNRPVASVADRKRRELADLDAYPAVLIDALLASEDNRFWWHPGVDPIGTARALLTNLLGGRVLEAAAP